LEQQKQDNIRNNSGNIATAKEEYIFLQRGDLLLKKVYGLPMPEDLIALLYGGGTTMQLKEMLTQAFYAISYVEKVPCVVAGLSLFDSKKRGLVANIALRGTNASGDLVTCHRLMLLLENLQTIDMTKNIFIVGDLPSKWQFFTDEVKKGVSTDIGIPLSTIDEVLKKYPSDMEKQIALLKKHKINIPVPILQEAVIARKINLTPEMKKRGVISIEEVAKIKKARKFFLRPYFKSLNLWFEGEFSNESMSAFLAEKYIREAIRVGVTERDLILIYTITEIENTIIKSAVQYPINLLSERLDDQEAFLLKSAGVKYELGLQKEVIEFLIKLFPEIGRTAEEYQLFLLDIKDRVMTGSN